MTWQPGQTLNFVKHDTLSIVKRSMLFMIILVVVIFMVAITATWRVASDQNERADLRSAQLLKKALDNRTATIRDHLADYADWGEAYINLHQSMNIQWAWDGQNLGDSLYKLFQYEGVFVISPTGQTQYSVINGQRQLEPFESWLDAPVLNSLQDELTFSKGLPLTRIVIANGEPVIIGAAWIKAGSDASVRPTPDKPSLMIFVDKLTPEKLVLMGHEYAIEQVGFKPPDTLADVPPYREGLVRIPTDDGGITLSWKSDDPGGALLKWEFPLLLSMGVIILLFIAAVLRSVLAKARINDHNVWLLKQSQLALAASERRFRDVAEATTDWIWEMDEHLQFTWISDRFPAITGYQTRQWLGRCVTDFLPQSATAIKGWFNDPCADPIFTRKNCGYLSAQAQGRYCNIVIKRVSVSGGVTTFRGTATDVTAELEAQERVKFLSFHDELTGLPNRIYLKDFLESKLREQPYFGNQIAVITLDLDKFKPVNDLFGHAAGDKLLKQVAHRLEGCISKNDLVSRHGGDEFVIILPDIQHDADVDAVCKNITAALSSPFKIVDNNDIFIGVSMGIALYPKDTQTPWDLMRFSDIALYEAKKDEHTRWIYFNQNMIEQIIQRREMENDLRCAINENQFILYYQPRYDLKVSRVQAVEALVRWEHPTLGLLMPDQFIPLAESSGLIMGLSRWVLIKACMDISESLPAMTLSVNISAVEFLNPGLVERVKEALRVSGLPAAQLELEVTENVTLSQPERVLDIMHELKSLGVRFLIDDFGTGYSSLNYLRTFPFDGIKLDKSFIFAMESSDSAKDVIENMINLGKSYCLNVTAEGVETSGQLSMLEKYKCDEAQGYYIGRPVPLDKIQLNKMM
ncbi:diguanylate cyclase [Enterobacter kobei]|uniref:Diguanylate cyclase n=1 Tax=Enterobacter kobei TaxID=208224 RepID=A0ACC8SDV5_9ENTR|nr:diguanylate cyclase [Enterobacter kobei]SIQ77183.1 PAS domain S-box-containing protein/diguanylate cyclase (GGDEF) domain-containing protein [Enterobacter kobei]